MTITLSLTVFYWTYKFFGVEDDQGLVRQMSQIGLIYTIVVGIYSFWKAAPYGKHSENSFLYGFQINAKVAWAIQESPAWIIPGILMYQSTCVHASSTPNIILMALCMAHCMNRSLIYPLRMSSRARPMPVLVCASAFLFVLYNVFLQGHSLLNVHLVNGASPFFIGGVLLFIIGMTINIWSDEILMSLRRHPGKKAKDEKESSSYKIPRGFLFEYVSGANYLGEILQWWGLGIASGAYPQILFAIFSTVFLGLRAWHSHKFYQKTFGKSYPSVRKAVIPFIL